MGRGKSLFKATDVIRATKAAAKAGVHVGKVVIDKQGNIAVFAKTVTDQTNELDKWIDTHHADDT